MTGWKITGWPAVAFVGIPWSIGVGTLLGWLIKGAMQ